MLLAVVDGEDVVVTKKFSFPTVVASVIDGLNSYPVVSDGGEAGCVPKV